MKVTEKQPHLFLRGSPNPVLIALFSLIGSAAWTLVGFLVAAFQQEVHSFMREWILIQGFFCVAAALFLGYLGASTSIDDTVEDIFHKGSFHRTGLLKSNKIRIFFCLLIFAVGFFSIVNLGFGASGGSRLFMWLTCVIVCALAGPATWHALELLNIASNIKRVPVRLFTYSPGKTRHLRRLAEHFAVFGVGITIGYIFAFAGTMSNQWTGSKEYIQVVQIFWPLIYVPLSLSILLYPHVEIYSLIRSEKDRVISGYQIQISDILESGEPLTNEDIDRVNSLADLIEKIEKSPNFALSLPVTLVAVTTSIVNIGSLLIPRQVAGDILRSYLLAP